MWWDSGTGIFLRLSLWKFLETSCFGTPAVVTPHFSFYKSSCWTSIFGIYFKLRMQECHIVLLRLLKMCKIGFFKCTCQEHIVFCNCNASIPYKPPAIVKMLSRLDLPLQFYQQLYQLTQSSKSYGVTNANKRKICKICSKLTLNTSVFTVNFEQISHMIFVFPLMSLNK